ncbi:MAG: translation initiation factor IF-6 [Nanoarchaeota archaeon]|nr:translation initiation factor IF-6 [Nanoarchaeota archaeon]
MHVAIASINANPNIGLYCYCNDSFCLVPKSFPENLKKVFEDVLKVPVFNVTLAGTSLIGVFTAGNKNTILVPEIVFRNEFAELDRLKIKYTVVKSELTALGNNIICNDAGSIVNPDYDDRLIEFLSKELKVPVKKGKINELDTVGSLARVTEKYGLIHNEARDFEIRFIEDNLNVKLTRGSVNFGSPYISSGVICNKNGFIIGDVSGGPEIQNADEAFGFIV